MKIFKQISVMLVMAVMFGIGFAVQGQTMVNNRNVKFLVKQLEVNADQFRDSVDIELENDRREALIEARIAAFEFATDQLKERIEDNEFIPSDLESVLSRALLIERELQPVKLSADARQDWMRVRNNLDELAKAYNVAWVWTLDANPYWKNPNAAERVVDDLEDSADAFRRSFDYALDTSRFNGTATENNAIKLADEFEEQIDKWEDLADNERLSQANVELLLKRAAAIEAFLQANNIVMPRAWRDWLKVRANLDELAILANVNWKWNVTPIITSDKVSWAQ